MNDNFPIEDEEVQEFPEQVEPEQPQGMTRRRRNFYIAVVVLVLSIACGLIGNFLVIPAVQDVMAKANLSLPAVSQPVAAQPETAAPVVEQPLVEVPVVAEQPVTEQPAPKEEVKPEVKEEPKTPEDARQVGSGADIINGWTDPAAEAQIIGGSFSTKVRSFMAAEGTSPAATQVVCVSSDPGLIQKKDSSGNVLVSWRDPEKGFVACIVLNPGETIEVIGVGYNDANGHFNTWSEVYAIPEGVKADDVAKLKIDEWQQREKKPFAFSFYDGATEPTFLAQP